MSERTPKPFEAAVRLLLDLHVLMETGEGSGEEANQIRELLNVYWGYCNPDYQPELRMNEQEIAAFDLVSIHLAIQNSRDVILPFETALRCWLELIVLMDTGKDDTVESDAVRDRLDIPYGWCSNSKIADRLSEREKEVLIQVVCLIHHSDDPDAPKQMKAILDFKSDSCKEYYNQ